MAHFNILHIIITSELLSSRSLLRSSKILIQRDVLDILPPAFIFSKDNGVFHLMGSSCGLMIPGRGHDQTVLKGIESLNEQNAATILSCEKIISTEPNRVIVIIILCTRLLSGNLGIISNRTVLMLEGASKWRIICYLLKKNSWFSDDFCHKALKNSYF